MLNKMNVNKLIKRRSIKINEDVNDYDDILDYDDSESSYDLTSMYKNDSDDVFGDSVINDQDDDDIETYDVIDVNDKTIKTTLVNMLRDELKKKEPNRDFLRFRYRGEICDGVPISEINPSKFIFKIDDKLRGVNLSEIKIL